MPTSTKTYCTEGPSEVTKESSQQATRRFKLEATAEEQQPHEQQQQQSGRPTACRWGAEDMRPVQAEPAECNLKHSRRGAGAGDKEA